MGKSNRQIRIDVKANTAQLDKLERGMKSTNKVFDLMLKEMRQMNSGMDTMASKMDRVAGASNRTATATKKLNKSLGQKMKSLTRVTASVLSYYAVLNRLRNLIVGVARWIFESIKAVDKMDARMSVASSTVGSMNQQFEFTNKLAQRLGLNVIDLTTSYAGFAVAAKGMKKSNIDKTFAGFSTATRAMGLSADETRGVFRALEQIMSKGKVQAEELRGQLGERLPGAFQMAADAIGVTTGELDKMLKSGEVIGKDLIPKMADLMEGRFAKAAAQMANTVDAQVQQMRGNWTLLGKTVGDEVAPTVVDSLRNINEQLIDLNENWEGSGPQKMVQFFVAGYHAIMSMTAATSAVERAFDAMGQGIASVMAKIVSGIANRMLELINGLPKIVQAGIPGLEQYKQAFKGLADGAETAANKAGRLAGVMTKDVVDGLQKSKDHLDKAKDALDGLSEAGAKWNRETGDISEGTEDLSEQAKAYAKNLADLETELDGVVGALWPYEKAVKDITEQKKLLVIAEAFGLISHEKMVEGLALLNKQLKELAENQRNINWDLVFPDIDPKTGLPKGVKDIGLPQAETQFPELGGKKGGFWAFMDGMDAKTIKNMERFGKNLDKMGNQFGAAASAGIQFIAMLKNISKQRANVSNLKAVWENDKTEENLAKVKGAQTEMAMGYVQMAQAGVAMMEELGILKYNPHRKTSHSFDGTSVEISAGGDYSREGAVYGEIAGAIIGGIVGSLAFGIGAIPGAIIGGAIGKMLGKIVGSFIEMGPSDLEIEFNMDDDNQFDYVVKQAEDGLDALVDPLTSALSDGLDTIFSAFELVPESIRYSYLRVRGDVVTAFVAGTERTFEEVSDAMDWMLTEMLKTASFSEGSPEVIAALQNSNAETMEELIQELDFAKLVSRMHLPEFTQKLLELADNFRAMKQEATKLGISTSKIETAYFNDLMKMHDNLLGITKSELQLKIEQAVQFNDFLKAQLAKAAITQEQYNALLVDPSKIKVGGKGKGGGRKARRASLQSEIENILDPFGRELRNLDKWLEDSTKEAKKLGVSVEDLTAAYDKQRETLLQNKFIDLLAAITNRMEDGPEKEQMMYDLAVLRWKLEIANMEAQLEFLYEAGHLSDEVYANLKGIINDFKNMEPPDWAAGQGNGSGGDNGGLPDSGMATMNTVWEGAGQYLFQDGFMKKLGGSLDISKLSAAVWHAITSGDVDAMKAVGLKLFTSPFKNKESDSGGSTPPERKTAEDFINQMQDPYDSFAELNEDFFRLSEAMKTAGLTDEIWKLKEAFQEAAVALKERLMEPLMAIKDSILGDTSNPFTSLQHYTGIRARLQEVAARALSGDGDALIELPQLIEQLQSGGENIFGGAGMASINAQIVALINALQAQGITFDPDDGYNTTPQAGFSAALVTSEGLLEEIRDELRAARVENRGQTRQTA